MMLISSDNEHKEFNHQGLENAINSPNSLKLALKIVNSSMLSNDINNLNGYDERLAADKPPTSIRTNLIFGWQSFIYQQVIPQPSTRSQTS
jgi:hypothetical protein